MEGQEQKLLKKKKLLLTKGLKHQLATVCSNLAELYLQQGKYEFAKNEYKNLAKLFHELKKPIEHAQANRMIGEVCTTLAEFEEALNYQQVHLDIAKEHQNKLEEQRALASIGRTYLTKAISDPDNINIASLDQANNSFEESLSIAKGLKDVSKIEVQDMIARLFLNIGVVQEHKGDFKKGVEYMMKCINICKVYSICDQLHHAFYTLGLLHTKNENYNEALNNFNLALQEAEKLSNRISALCTTYLAKAEVLIKTYEFYNATHVLIQAYKLKSPNLDEQRTIAHNLKLVAALYRTEDTLIITDENDYKKRKILYERMGDGAAELKIFEKAIDYYNKMLFCAKECGESGKDLLPVYVSLGQTYKDIKQYKLSYEYFLKEYEISRSNPKESYKTLLNIAVILELIKVSYEDIVETYNKARREAVATKNTKCEANVISHFITFLKKMGKQKEVEELQQELIKMNYESSDDESDGENATPDIGSDINIDDLIEEFCPEDSNESRQTRKRGRQFTVKKNLQGETQLHIASKDGNLALVTSLLNQGHSVNERDNYGWLPIHEACNYGHADIVKLLISKHSIIDDRDGKCKGITPLHDACTNGHLEVIQVLLESGASTTAQTNEGYTPLDLLISWKNNNGVDPELVPLYNTIFSKMSETLKKIGRSVDENITVDNAEALVTEKTKRQTPKKSPRVTSPRKSHKATPQKSPGSLLGNLRNSVDLTDNLSKPSCSTETSQEMRINSIKRNLSLTTINDESSSDSDASNPACNEYKRVMEGLRTRIPESKLKTSPKKQNKNKPAFLSVEETDDVWLDDDLKINQPKKRKRHSSVKQNFLESSGIRNIDDSNKFEFHSDIEIENLEPNINLTSGYDSSDSVNSISSSKRKRSQSSLLESGFSRRRSDSPLNRSSFNPSPTYVQRYSGKRQQKLNSFIDNRTPEPDSTSCSSITQNSQQLRPLLAINVRIENKLWRIPVPTNEVNVLTIEWLANEAAKRYYKQEGIKPTLQLLTKEGAILGNEDPLSMVFIPDTLTEELQSRIMLWNLPPLPERYVEACQLHKIEPCREIQKKIEECQGTLNLKLANISIKHDQLPPLFRAINRQNNLQHLDLTASKILNEGVKQLCSVLPSLVQLRSLNLSRNNITGEGIRFLSEIFINLERPILENLSDLDLSYNELNEDTLRYLAIILQNLKIQVLNLCGCGLPANIFNNNYNIGVVLNLQHLKTLNLSYNDLNTDDVMKFISFINFRIISNLDLSQNKNVSVSGITKTITDNLSQYESNNIQSLNLAKCKVNDSEIWDLLRALTKSEELDSFDLSYNIDLTAVSLRRILQHRPTFSSLNLLGCANILQYFDEFSFTSDATDRTCDINNLKTLKISINYIKRCQEAETLIKMWESEWGRRTQIKKFYGRALHFSVAD